MITIDGIGETPKALAKELGAKRTIPKKYIFRYGKNNVNIPDGSKLFNSSIYKFNKYTFLIGLDDLVRKNELTYFKPVEIIGLATPNFASLLKYGRKTSHSKGRDITLMLPGKTVKNDGYDFITKGVNVKREYRYHFVFNHLIPCLKYQEIETGDWKSDYIRNYDNGWRFSICKPRERLVKAVWWIKYMTGLDFGAVDLCIDKDNFVWIFEVNTAPSLDEINLKLYKEWFQEIVDLYEGGGTYEPMCAENPEAKSMSELFDIYQRPREDE